MTELPSSQRRSLTRWGRSAFILLVAGIGFVFTLQNSLAGAWRNTNPNAVLGFFPRDSQAVANIAATFVAKDPTPASIERARLMSIEALRRDPLNVTAVRTLALVNDAKGDRAGAWRLLNRAEALSRRDLLTQLSIIEYLSAAGDVDGTLRHYDVAMRASRASREILIPILIDAANDPALVDPIAKLVAQRPPQWWMDYMLPLVGGGPLAGASRIAGQVLDAKVPAERELLVSMLDRLEETKEFDLAWALYLRAFPEAAHADGGLVRDGGFNGEQPVPPFEWQYADEADLTAERRPDSSGDGQQLALLASNGRGGVLAKQLLRLDPGRYSLTITMGNVPAGVLDRPSVELSCAKGVGTTLFGMKAGAGGPGPIRGAGTFVVPGGCQWQWLSIRASGEGPATDTVPWVDNLRIERSR